MLREEHPVCRSGSETQIPAEIGNWNSTSGRNKREGQLGTVWVVLECKLPSEMVM